MIRPARPDELPALSALAQRSKAHWGYDEAFMRACRDELTLPPNAQHVWVLEDPSGRPIGFHQLGLLDDERGELEMLFVEPSDIGRGYGRRLMEHAKAELARLGRRLMIIQGDPNATRFYRAAGGRQIGERPSASIPGRSLPLFELDLRSSGTSPARGR